MWEPDHPGNFCFINAQMFSPFHPYSLPHPRGGGGGGGGGEGEGEGEGEGSLV